MRLFILGACTMACSVAGLLFLRFWRRTGERLFAIFGLAFWVLALNRIGLTLVDPANEARTHLYLGRLAAFVLILAAIIDKNRRQ